MWSFKIPVSVLKTIIPITGVSIGHRMYTDIFFNDSNLVETSMYITKKVDERNNFRSEYFRAGKCFRD